MFFWSDVLGTILATIAFLPLFFLPGWALGWLADVFQFRTLEFRWQVLVCVPMSMAISPLAGYLALRSGGMPLVATLLAIVFFICAIRLRLKPVSRRATGIALGWVILATLMLADMQFGEKVYFSAIANDHEFRVAVIDAITRTGLPPASPFNHLDGPVIMRYHVYWFGLCSIVQRLGFGLWDARAALNASVIWVGLALMATVPLALRFLLGSEGDTLRRRSFLGVALLAVTGLDLFPNLRLFLMHVVPPADMEWWTPDQVTSWFDAILWVPHHVAAIVAGFTGFILLFHAAERLSSVKARAYHAFIAGVAFASAVGCSIYVGFAFAAVLLGWTVFTLMRRWWPHVILLAVAGITATIFSIPNVLQLMGSDKGGGKFIALGLWFTMNSDWVIRQLGIGNRLGVVIIKSAYVLSTFFLELGLFFLLGIIQLRIYFKTRILRPQDCACLVLAGCALLLCTFVRSATISNNDLGWRGFMIIQFVLLLWATGLMEGPLLLKQKPRWLPAAMLLLLLGAAGTLYQLSWLRFEALVSDSGVFGEDAVDTNMGRRTYSLRILYRELDKLLPRSAIVQSNPDTIFDYWWGLYSHRQTAATGEDCTVAMGGNLDTCKAALPELQKLFDDSLNDPAAAYSIARRYKIDAVVIMDDDDIWNRPNAWTAKLKPAVTTRDARAYFIPSS